MEIVQAYDDEQAKASYMKDVLKVIHNADDDLTAPVIIAEISKLHKQYFGVSYSFDEIKAHYNRMLLREEKRIAEQIAAAPDQLLCAVKYARSGNYIDFGAMGSIDDKKLEKMLDSAQKEEIDAGEFKSFQADLKKGKHLAYLTDNCGEIVLDKLLMQVIHAQFPHLDITAVVRGKPVLNDATMEDAKAAGLSKIVKVIPNGTGIAGTYLNGIEKEARDVITRADLIVSKGQGNFETLHGCGLNIYYMFLCKCDWFVKRFHLERFEGVFINERNQKIS
jgi:uncharacterized protein with ATP-grasp and redox domains